MFRVLHILDHSLPVKDGYSFRSHAILREQLNRGWQPLVLTSPKHHESVGGEDRSDTTVDGVPIFRSAHKGNGLGSLRPELAVMAGLARRLDEVVVRERPQLLHAHSPVLNAFPALQVGRRHRLPVIYEMRASWEDAAVSMGKYREGSAKYRASRFLETVACRRVDHVTVLCDGLRGDVLARGLDEQKVTAIPNGVDTGRFSPDEASSDSRQRFDVEGRRVIGFLGSFFAWEGLDVLLEGMAILARTHKDAVLLLVGGGDLDAVLRARAARADLERCVRMPGPLPQHQVAEIYRLADVLVYPRLSSRLTELVTPLKPLEAMAMCKAVAASDVGGHRELIRHNETGVLFKAGSPSALAESVGALLDDDERRRRLARAGHQWVRSERTWKATTSAYESVYASVVHRT